MKKLSIISGILLIALTVFMAFTIYKPIDTTADKFKVHVIGCDDCSQLHYCIGGLSAVYPGSCDFTAECNPFGSSADQIICVRCGDKSGSALIHCGVTKEVTINFIASPSDCQCK
ncbi:MAG: hypothetical protein PHN88_10300 [Ignavibacteria bacterium]|nr:hypothetical protein [Ignavibacteria bacterium]